MTTRAVDAVLAFVALSAMAWIVCFALTGAAYARRLGATPLGGFVLGFVFGPFGWLIIWFIARRGREREYGRVSSADQPRVRPRAEARSAPTRTDGSPW